MRTILAVDDSEEVRGCLARLLRFAGYRVIEAVDGADGIEKLNRNRVDIVISDLDMPNLDGIGLIRYIRNCDRCRNIPVIVLTGDTLELRKREGMTAGATDWISKPVRPNLLFATVENILEGCCT